MCCRLFLYHLSLVFLCFTFEIREHSKALTQLSYDTGLEYCIQAFAIGFRNVNCPCKMKCKWPFELPFC